MLFDKDGANKTSCLVMMAQLNPEVPIENWSHRLIDNTQRQPGERYRG